MASPNEDSLHAHEANVNPTYKYFQVFLCYIWYWIYYYLHTFNLLTEKLPAAYASPFNESVQVSK